jgi:Co/Zn/Cd efflux system component
MVTAVFIAPWLKRLIAFVIWAVLLGIVAFALVGVAIRIFNPEPVPGMTMMIVAGVALLGNGLAT